MTVQNLSPRPLCAFAAPFVADFAGRLFIVGLGVCCDDEELTP